LGVPGSVLEKLLWNSNRSRFERLEEIFNRGERPEFAVMKEDLVLGGRCIPKAEPERMYKALANVYAVTRSGRLFRTYFMPEVRNEEQDVRISKQEAIRQHAYKRREIAKYTPVSGKVRGDVRLDLLMRQRMKDMLSFVYDSGEGKVHTVEAMTHPNEVPLDITYQRGKLGDKIYNGLRLVREVDGRRFWVMKQVCLSYPGCVSERGRYQYYVQYGETYQYCYFNRGIKVKR
jgi:hypothetical protein